MFFKIKKDATDEQLENLTTGIFIFFSLQISERSLLVFVVVDYQKHLK